MKILQFGKYHWSSPGGLERYLGQMYHCFRRPHYDVETDYVVFDKSGRSSVEENDGGRVIRIGTLGKLRGAPIPMPSRVWSSMLKTRYDVVQFHHPNPTMQPLFDFVASRQPSARRVVFWHSDIVRQRLLKRCYAPWERRLLRNAHGIIVTSPTYLAGSQDLEGVANKCCPLPFGQTVRVAHPIIPERPTVLSVGRLVSYKGFEYLVEAMTHDTLRAVRLVIVGDGPLREPLCAKIRRHSLEGRVKIIGHVSEEELARCYESCSLFVLPSITRAEAFGIVILEAMAYGKPIVTTAIGSGMEYLVQDGKNGLLVQPRSPGALASAIHQILSSRAMQESMGQASLERVHTTFHVDRHFSMLCDYYRSLVR